MLPEREIDLNVIFWNKLFLPFVWVLLCEMQFFIYWLAVQYQNGAFVDLKLSFQSVLMSVFKNTNAFWRNILISRFEFLYFSHIDIQFFIE